MRLGLGKSPRFDAWMAQQGRSRGRWGSRPGSGGYTFQDVIDQGEGDGAGARGVLLTLPGEVVDWINDRAEELQISASDVVVDALEVRAALDVAPQMVDLVRGGRQEYQHE